MPAAEHVKRQVAVAIIVAVEEAAFLIAVQRVVRGVEVEDDLLGRPVVRLEQQVDEQGLDRRGLDVRSCSTSWASRATVRAD